VGQVLRQWPTGPRKHRHGKGDQRASLPQGARRARGDGRIVYVPADLKPSLVAQVERVRALERQTGPIIPYLYPHFAGQHWGERIKDFVRRWRTA